jgi:hypothetical protein
MFLFLLAFLVDVGVSSPMTIIRNAWLLLHDVKLKAEAIRASW